MAIEITELKTLHKGWNTLSQATIRLADGQSITRIIEDHGDAAVVLPYDPVRRCAILVRQFRPPAFLVRGETSVLEAIAGMIEDGEAEACGKREAMEEAGLQLAALEHVAGAWSSAGFTTERFELFLAEYGAADRIGDGGGLAEEHEDIEVVELPLADLAAMADRGAIDDLKTLTLVQTLRLKRPDLF